MPTAVSAPRSVVFVKGMWGMSQKNAARLQKDGAIGFLGKSALELNKGSEKLLTAVQEILQKLPEAVRTAG